MDFTSLALMAFEKKEISRTATPLSAVWKVQRDNHTDPSKEIFSLKDWCIKLLYNTNELAEQRKNNVRKASVTVVTLCELKRK